MNSACKLTHAFFFGSVFPLPIDIELELPVRRDSHMQQPWRITHSY